MSKLQDMLDYNKAFVENKEYEQYITTKNPNKKIVILSCMDTRLTELLPKALNIKNGDAKIVKNAGATIMHPFGSIMRSIIVAIYEFNADEVFVVGHKGCGMSNINSELIIRKAINAGTSQEAIDTLINAGIDIDNWLHGFDSVEQSIIERVNTIKNHPLVNNKVKIYGLLMDSKTGEVEVITNGYE